jgi:hypothetical protein
MSSVAAVLHVKMLEEEKKKCSIMNMPPKSSGIKFHTLRY